LSGRQVPVVRSLASSREIARSGRATCFDITQIWFMQAVTLFSRIAHVKDKKRSFKCDQFTFIVWSNRLIREAFRRQFRKLLPPAAILSRPAVLSARLSPVHCPLFQ